MTVQPSALEVEEAARKRRADRVGRRGVNAGSALQRWGLLLVLLFILAFFSVTLPDTFATSRNFFDILVAQPPLVFIGLAAMLALIVGEFDLSIGATVGLSQYLVLLLLVQTGLDWPTAVGLVVLVGVAIGMINAVLIVGFGINSFIATIGVQTILLGLLELISGGFQPIFTGAPESFTAVARTEVLGVPVAVGYAALVALLLWALLNFTVIGRELRATGAGRAAAALSGIHTKRALAIALVGASLLASVGGILMTARAGSADAVSGPLYLLPAYAAAFLGATGIRPGTYNVWGTVIAIFLVAVGITGLQLFGAASWVTPVFNGGALLAAVLLSKFAGRGKSRPRKRRNISAMKTRAEAGI